MNDTMTQKETLFSLAMGIYAILFTSASPVPIAAIVGKMNIPRLVFEGAISVLETEILEHSPLMVHQVDGTLALLTRPEYADYVKAVHDIKQLGITQKLSDEAMCTLAIIAYYQPITKDEIDRKRGNTRGNGLGDDEVVSGSLDSEKTLMTLKRYGLIEAVGTLPKPGAPAVYRTTTLFLNKFGLKDISELPTIEALQ